MALRACNECKKEISTSAEVCPHCGYKQKQPSGCLILFVGFIIISFLSVLFSAISDFSADKSNSTNVVSDEKNTKDIILKENSFPTPDSCSYLEELQGYEPSSYKPFDNDSEDYMCGTLYKDIGGHPEFELANNISYYVLGDVKQGNTLKLILNVNQKNNAKSAKAELLKAAQLLYVKAYNQDLPKAIQKAIKNGKANEWSDSRYITKIEKEIWPGNKGYELHFLILAK